MSKKEPKQILFYSRDETYGWLSNFHRSPQKVDGKIYPTNEHYYQSQKAKYPEDARWIAAAPIPFLAMKAGRALRKKKGLRDDWGEQVKIGVMLTGLRAKFGQNPELKKKLLATGDAILHENSPIDMFWGIKGKSMLGKLLMQVRQDFQRTERLKSIQRKHRERQKTKETTAK